MPVGPPVLIGPGRALRLVFSPTSGTPHLLYRHAETGVITLAQFGNTWSVVAGKPVSPVSSWGADLAFDAQVSFHGDAAVGAQAAGAILNACHSTTAPWLQGKPYVAAVESGNPVRVVIRRLESAQWAQLGAALQSSPPYMSPEDGNYVYRPVSIAVDVNGIPYVAYTVNYGAAVYKFEVGRWTAVGDQASLSSNNDDYTTMTVQLALDSLATPILVTQLLFYATCTVRRFDGAAWQSIGDVQAYGITLAIDASDVPHLAIRDPTANYRATVLRYDGAAWEPLGPRGFNREPSLLMPVLALSPTSTPYVAYVYGDGGTPSNVAVMRYDGAGWINVGSTTYTASAWDVGLAFHPSTPTQPYLAYTGDALQVLRWPGPGRQPPRCAGVGWRRRGETQARVESCSSGRNARDAC